MPVLRIYGHPLLTCAFNLFGWIIAVVVFSPILPIVLILMIWKFLIVKPIAPLLASNKIRSFGVADTLCSTDLYWEKPVASLAVMYFLQGNIDIKEFTEDFQKRILEARGPENNLIYENLISIPTNILGYYFWETDHAFNIENHIISIERQISETELKDLIPQWLAMPFPKQKSLWDIRILTNYKPEPLSESQVTVILPRIHHAAGDGYTFMKMMNRLAGVDFISAPTEEKQSVMEKIKFAVQLPSIMGRFIWKNIDILFKRGLFSQPLVKDEYFISWKEMPLDKWRTLRRATKAHFSSVGLSLLTEALAKYGKSAWNISMPNQTLHIASVLPRPGHPNDRMANHARIGIMSIPLEILNQDSMDHILKTEQEFLRVTEEGEPIMIEWIVVPFISLLPSCIFRLLHRTDFGMRVAFTGTMSNSSNELQICNTHVLAVIPLTAPLHSHLGILGFIGNFRQTAILTVLARSDICASRAAVEEICNYVEEGMQEKLKDLEIAASTDVTIPSDSKSITK